MIKFWAGATACLVGLCAGYGLASRNSSGTMSAINGPYAAPNVISSSQVNARLADIETELTASLERSGKGGMLAALRGADGTVAAPAFSFTSETGSGWYRIGSSDLGLAIAGTKKLELTSSLFTVTPNASFTGVLLGSNGAVGAPTYSFTNDATAGLYRGGSADFRFAVSGADKTFWNATGFGIGGAPGALFDVEQSGSASSTIAQLLQASLANGNFTAFYLGKAVSANNAGNLTYTPSATAANSTMCMQMTGQSGTLCVDGNAKTYIGASGTGTTQMNFGSCTLNGASPSVCTATVASGAKCVAIDVATTAATRCLATSVTTTTLTVTSCNGNTNVVNYVCF